MSKNLEAFKSMVNVHGELHLNKALTDLLFEWIEKRELLSAEMLIAINEHLNKRMAGNE
jgi:hypothetical protein